MIPCVNGNVCSLYINKDIRMKIQYEKSKIFIDIAPHGVAV